MARKLALIPLALLLAALSAPSCWAFGAPLMKGVTPAKLADLVERSLKSQPDGSARLDSERCKRDGSCATPRMYLEGIKADHPSARLNGLADLPRYLRTLVEHRGPKGIWHMSRLLVKGDTVRYDSKGWWRAFHKREGAWFDPNTGEPVLAGDCSNIVGKAFSPRPKWPHRHIARQLYRSPPAKQAPNPVFYVKSHPEFGTFPQAVCPPGLRPHCG